MEEPAPVTTFFSTDHLDAGHRPASELAERAGLHALIVTRSPRAAAD